MLSETIKTLRKQAGMSQEQLAGRLNVSRQAVTKWETAAGTPDVENLRAISALFQISLDDLLENRSPIPPEQEFRFHSVTEYDIDSIKDFDITFSGANGVVMTGYEGEKLQVLLGSDQIANLDSAFKVKIDDIKKRIDVDVRRFAGMTESNAKESLHILIRLPQQYVGKIELSGNTQSLELQNVRAENAEFSGKVSRTLLNGFSGRLELNSNTDMEITCHDLNGPLDVNQVSATSRLTLPQDLPFCTVTRGILNSIHYQKDGKTAKDFSLRGEDAGHCDNVIELNGIKSELIINASSHKIP